VRSGLSDGGDRNSAFATIAEFYACESASFVLASPISDHNQYAYGDDCEKPEDESDAREHVNQYFAAKPPFTTPVSMRYTEERIV
jgi:hypothetical protein